MPSAVTEAAVSRDPARATVAALFVAGLCLASLWVLQPFLLAAVWATTLVVATWPLLLRLQSLLGGRRRLAVSLMTAGLLLGFIIPLALALLAIVAHAGDIAGLFQSLATWSVPPPPEWVVRIPLVGPRLAAGWTGVEAAGSENLVARLAPYTALIVGWVAYLAGSLGVVLVQFVLVVLFAAILYARGATAAEGARRFARRVAGVRGERCARIAAQAIRGVALGLVVTALVQACLAAIGLAVAGVPFAALLSALIFVLCIAQIGPAPVLLLAVAWTYWSGDTGWGTALLVWSIFVGGIDNVLRPILIRKGADLPLLLIFVGVVGGLLAFGVVGIFVGPVVLAVGYSLFVDWVNTVEPKSS